MLLPPSSNSIHTHERKTKLCVLNEYNTTRHDRSSGGKRKENDEGQAIISTLTFCCLLLGEEKKNDQMVFVVSILHHLISIITEWKKKEKTKRDRKLLWIRLRNGRMEGENRHKRSLFFTFFFFGFFVFFCVKLLSFFLSLAQVDTSSHIELWSKPRESPPGARLWASDIIQPKLGTKHKKMSVSCLKVRERERDQIQMVFLFFHLCFFLSRSFRRKNRGRRAGGEPQTLSLSPSLTLLNIIRQGERTSTHTHAHFHSLDSLFLFLCPAEKRKKEGIPNATVHG